jgi:parallel beta-helix repeat protein
MKIKDVIFVTAFVWAIGIGAATKAMAVVPNCSVVTPVTESCGWVITTPGCYKLLNNLTAVTDAGDCIQINSSNVFLDLNTQTITGTGATSTGNGIHVLAATIPGGVAIANVAIQGGRSISAFGVGVLVGNTTNPVNTAPFPTKIRLDNVTAVGNNLMGFYLYNSKASQLSGLSETQGTTSFASGLTITGGSGNHVSNSTFTANDDGVDVNSSSGNVFSAVEASSNAAYGFYIGLTGPATGNQIASPSADSNGGAGIIVHNKSNGNTIAGGHANSNGPTLGLGIFVTQSSGNQISGINLSNNSWVGIYLGCDGPTTGTCTAGVSGSPLSNGNGIDANVSITGSLYGIAIDKGNLNNTIVGNTSSGNATLDEYDANACGVNNWFADNFGTSSASCVH